jgi:hypothetical protein
MDNRRFYTYAWLREDGTPYYIGKGTGYRAYTGKGRKGNRKPPKDKSRILILKKNLTEEEAFKHEIYMIALYGRKDNGTGILINLTDGGDGVPGMTELRWFRDPCGKSQGRFLPGGQPEGWETGRHPFNWKKPKKVYPPKKTKEQVSAAIKKAANQRTPENRSDASRRGWERLTDEERKTRAEKSMHAILTTEVREKLKKIQVERYGKSVEITTPEGKILIFPSVREASRQTGLHPYVLRRLLNNEGAKSQQGHTARFL